MSYYCCEEFDKATSSGSDSEHWGPLIDLTNGFNFSGDRLEKINFCPWCGKNLRQGE